MLRWTFTDPSVVDADGNFESFVFDVNPTSSGHPRKKNYSKQSTASNFGKNIIFEGRRTPDSIDFSGKIFTENEYNALLNWYNKRNQIQLVDDHGETFWIYISKLSFSRVRAYHKPWKHTYECSAIILDWGNVEQLRFLTVSVDSARNGTPYSFSMEAFGGSGQYVWSASGLPNGLSISSSGLISGTPSSAVDSYVTISVSDGLRTISKQFAILVEQALAISVSGLSLSIAYGSHLVGKQNISPSGYALPIGYGSLSIRLTTGLIVSGLSVSVNSGSPTIASSKGLSVSSHSVILGFGAPSIKLDVLQNAWTKAHIINGYEEILTLDSNYTGFHATGGAGTGTFFVAMSGNDATGSGTISSPYRTIVKALAQSGVTYVVCRQGTYREKIGVTSRSVTLQAYPHEVVWIKGSTDVTSSNNDVNYSWTSVSNGWKLVPTVDVTLASTTTIDAGTGKYPFHAGMIGCIVTGSGIPAGTTISSMSSGSNTGQDSGRYQRCVISAAATLSGSSTLTLGVGGALDRTSGTSGTVAFDSGLINNYAANSTAGEPLTCFVNGEKKVRKSYSAGTVLGDGEYMYDSTNQIFYLGSGTSPASNTLVEITSLGYFIAASATFTLAGLGIVHFGGNINTSNANYAAVRLDGANSQVLGCTIALNHGYGLSCRTGSGMKVKKNLILRNGCNGGHQTSSQSLLLEGNRIAYNNDEYYDIGINKGNFLVGTFASWKATNNTANSVFRLNIIHDNRSNGLWVDRVFASRTVTLNANTDTCTYASHGWPDGHPIIFDSLSNISGLSTGTTYYVAASTTDTFQLADSLGSVIFFSGSSTGSGVVSKNLQVQPSPCYNNQMVRNIISNNDGVGLYFELTEQPICAGNLIVNNGRDGVKFSSAASARSYHNTFYGNGWAGPNIAGGSSPDPAGKIKWWTDTTAGPSFDEAVYWVDSRYGTWNNSFAGGNGVPAAATGSGDMKSNVFVSSNPASDTSGARLVKVINQISSVTKAGTDILSYQDYNGYVRMVSNSPSVLLALANAGSTGTTNYSLLTDLKSAYASRETNAPAELNGNATTGMTIPSGSMSHWQSAVSSRTVHIVQFGDSTVHGVAGNQDIASGGSGSEPEILRTLLPYPSAGSGFSGLWRAEWSFAGTWTSVAWTSPLDIAPWSSSTGVKAGGVYSAAASSSNIVTWTKPTGYNDTIFDLYIVDHSSLGVGSYSVDGGTSWINLPNQSGSSTASLVKVRIVGATSIKVRAANASGTGAAVALAGVACYEVDPSTPGYVCVHNFGNRGSHMSDLYHTSSGSPFLLLQSLGCDCAIIGSLTNETGSGTTFQTSLVSLVGALRTIMNNANLDVLILGQFYQMLQRVISNVTVTLPKTLTAASGSFSYPLIDDINRDLDATGTGVLNSVARIASESSSSSATMDLSATTAGTVTLTLTGRTKTQMDALRTQAVAAAASLGVASLDLGIAPGLYSTGELNKQNGLLYDQYHPYTAGYRIIAGLIAQVLTSQPTVFVNRMAGNYAISSSSSMNVSGAALPSNIVTALNSADDTNYVLTLSTSSTPRIGVDTSWLLTNTWI